MRISKKPTADQLDDYDIELIADKIENTGRIATEVSRQLSDEIRKVTKLLEASIKREVRKALHDGSLEMNEATVKNEVLIKLIKGMLGGEE